MQTNNSAQPNLDRSPQGLKELQSQQNNDPGAIKLKKGSGDKAYKLPAHETHLVHVEIHEPQFNPQTGQDEGRKFVQKFDAKEYAHMEKTSAFAGKKVRVLHDPTGEAEDVKPDDHLKPQVVSQPGAGLPLDVNLEELKYPDLQKYWRELFKDVADRKEPKAKEDLIAEIKERVAFVKSEADSQSGF